MCPLPEMSKEMSVKPRLLDQQHHKPPVLQECLHPLTLCGTNMFSIAILGLNALGDSHMKRMGVLIVNFEKKNPKRYQDPVLWVWLQIFSPLLVPILITTHYFLSYFFLLNTLKGVVKASSGALSGPNTLKDAKTIFLTPKMYDKHPCPFYSHLVVTNDKRMNTVCKSKSTFLHRC